MSFDGDDRVTYPPLNTLKPVADDVWIVDGPALRFGPYCLRMPFPTRMTVVRVASHQLFVHSPTPLTADLRQQVASVGAPAWIVGPNRIHYWWIPEWKTAYSDAEAWLAPGIRQRAGGRIDFPARELQRSDHYPWDKAIATLPVRSRYMTEFVFLHQASRTLILADLIENFEPQKLSRAAQWLTFIGGVQHPDGQMPRDMRLTYIGRKDELRRAVETMIAWRPQRIILAHGRCYDANAVGELRRAFRWLRPR